LKTWVSLKSAKKGLTEVIVAMREIANLLKFNFLLMLIT
jgi:hypothetical protein